MNIQFGLELDDRVYPVPPSSIAGFCQIGPQKLLNLLETQLGLTGYPSNNEYLRIEIFRQILDYKLQKGQNLFFEASFHADPLATAARILQMRDELKLCGWDFLYTDETPERLRVIAEIEAALQDDAARNFPAGFADRFVDIMEKLDTRQHLIISIQLNEPLEMLPAYFQHLLKKLEATGVSLSKVSSPDHTLSNDLALFKHALLHPSPEKKRLKSDGSLLLLYAKRETEAAIFLASLIRKNPKMHPLCLIPEKNRALDNAFIREGMPSLGILSASQARPSLQILKLIPAFLWHPLDPFKILEFVSLPIKPIDDRLAFHIANQIAKTPGIHSENWFKMIGMFFGKLEEQAQADPSIKVKKTRDQYNFWFERKRYHQSRSVPKGEVIEIFKYIAKWAMQAFEETGGKNSSLVVLSEQSRRVSELLETLPESEPNLSQLKLERIVRTIYQPSPIVFKDTQENHLPYIYHNSAITDNTDQLIWWNFIRKEQEQFFSNWYNTEIAYLKESEVRLQSPAEQNALTLWQRLRPVLYAQKKMILVVPHYVNGSEVHPNPLHDELMAAFESLGSISFNIDNEQGRAAFEKHFTVPNKKIVAPFMLGKPKPFASISQKEKIKPRNKETFSSLESLFYFPYQWVFQHKIKLFKSSILSVTKDNTLLGNLAHRLLEKLFNQEKFYYWDKEKLSSWIDKEMPDLLRKEGSVLLMYGREPEKIAFINKMKYASWTLKSMICDNNWKVKKTEMDLGGKFMGLPVKGKADLVLERGDELAVVDLKWRGARRRMNAIRNKEDLQLVMYARLLEDDQRWTHTAFFIIEDARMIARNNQAFQEAECVAPDEDHILIYDEIWKKMENTYQWRLDQLQNGLIEIRTEQTVREIEEFYGDLLDKDILEMKSGDAWFDDYRTLINLIR